MRTAVNLNDNATLRTVKINDKVPDNFLPVKIQTI